MNPIRFRIIIIEERILELQAKRDRLRSFGFNTDLQLEANIVDGTIQFLQSRLVELGGDPLDIL